MRRKKRSTIKNYILFLLAIILGGGGAYFYQDVSFDKSKKLLLKRVYFDHQVTFYCQNPYEIKTKDGKEQDRKSVV